MKLFNQTTTIARQRQNGGALLVAMIMIFMLSIMGVSSMQGSTLERRMATNSIQTATTFQGAESTSEMALNQEVLMTDAINAADIELVNSGDLTGSVQIPFEVNLQQDIGMESDAAVQFVGTGPAYGFSVGADGFKAFRFIVTGESQVTAIRAKKTVVQGAYRVGPG